VPSQTGSRLLPPENLGGAFTVLTDLPVVVIGAGPVGLAAAVQLLDRGLEPLVLEAGPQVGNNIAQWRHVRLFSPWCLALDPISVRFLDQAGWTGLDLDALPTGRDLLDAYLTPLAAVPVLSSRIRLNTRVVAIARRDLDKVRRPGREQLPFLVRVRSEQGRLKDLHARVATLAGDHADADQRHPGPPAAALCATNRQFMAAAHRRLLVAPVAEAQSGSCWVRGSTATDWSSATCC
jgi:glycine/D-amino acid oxidase-like deaminating enzyme